MQVVTELSKKHGEATCALNMHNVIISGGHSVSDGTHSVIDMIYKSAKCGIQLRSTHIYTNSFPCDKCATALIAIDITKLVVLKIPNFFKDSQIYKTYQLLDENDINVEFYEYPELTINLLPFLEPVYLYHKLFEEGLVKSLYNTYYDEYDEYKNKVTRCSMFSTSSEYRDNPYTEISGEIHQVSQMPYSMLDLRRKLEIITDRKYESCLMMFVEDEEESYNVLPNSCIVFLSETRPFIFEDKHKLNVHVGSVIISSELSETINFKSTHTTRKTIVLTFV